MENKEGLIKCDKCNGDGYTSEHAEEYGSHDGEGNCNGFCPIQVQCEKCQATGYLTPLTPSVINEEQ